MKPCVYSGNDCEYDEACCGCTIKVSYLELERELIEQHLEELRTMSEEKRKYMEAQVLRATGKDKEIDEDES